MIHLIASLVKKISYRGYTRLTRLASPWLKKRQAKVSASLIADPEFRYKFARQTIESFNGGVGPKPAGTTRIFSVWEGDGRMIWLSYAASADPACEVFHVSRTIFDGVFSRLLKPFVDEKSREQVGEINLEAYYADAYSSLRQQFREYCKDVMKYLGEYYDVDVWLLPKLNDDWIVDLIMALKELDWPLVINDRESQMSPRRLQVYPEILKKYIKDCEPDLSVVNNEYHKEFFILSGHDPAKIVLTGKPDSDYWHRQDLWKTLHQLDPRLSQDRFKILYFSFGPRAYLNFYFGRETRTWTPLAEGYHEVLLDILKKYHDRVQLVYKTSVKEARDKYSQVNLFHQQAQQMDKDCIVAIGGGVSSVELVRCVDVVLGFQTQGLTEAMFTGTNIVYGAWGELYDEIKDWLLPYHQTDSLFYAKSQEEMYDYIVSLIEGQDKYKVTEAMLAARKTFRELYFYNPDGNVSKRILDEAKRLAEQWPGRRPPA